MVFGVSPFTNPAVPPALLRGSALQKGPREARRLVGRLVRATGQDQNKKGPEDGRLSLHPDAAIGSPRKATERSEPIFTDVFRLSAMR